MKKKVLTVMSALTFLVSSNVSGGIIPLNPGYGDDMPIIVIPHKGPIHCPQVDITDHVFTSVELSYCNYTLGLLDENDNVVFSQYVSVGTSQVLLPTTLTGDFKLVIIPDDCDYYYYGFCTM